MSVRSNATNGAPRLWKYGFVIGACSIPSTVATIVTSTETGGSMFTPQVVNSPLGGGPKSPGSSAWAAGIPKMTPNKPTATAASPTFNSCATCFHSQEDPERREPTVGLLADQPVRCEAHSPDIRSGGSGPAPQRDGRASSARPPDDEVRRVLFCETNAHHRVGPPTEKLECSIVRTVAADVAGGRVAACGARNTSNRAVKNPHRPHRPRLDLRRPARRR